MGMTVYQVAARGASLLAVWTRAWTRRTEKSGGDSWLFS